MATDKLSATVMSVRVASVVPDNAATFRLRLLVTFVMKIGIALDSRTMLSTEAFFTADKRDPAANDVDRAVLLA
jgi:hypothetical protein